MKINILNCLKSRKNTGSSKHLYKQAYAVLESSLLGLSGGITAGISAALLPQLENNEEFHWTKEYSSWMASLAPIAAVLGCMCIGRLLDRFGRKAAHIMLAVPFAVGWISMAFANNFYTMLIGRFLCGFAYGAVKSVTVIYLGEISEPQYRGILLVFPSLAGNLGVLISHIAGTFTVWRTALLISLIPNLLLFAMHYFFKESPYWLISKGRTDEGIENFRAFRGIGESAENELSDVINKQKSKGTDMTTKELLTIVCSGRFIKPTVILIVIFIAIQFNGVNAFPFYANDLIDAMFGAKIDTFLVLIVMDVIRVVVCIFMCLIGKHMHRRASFLFCAYATALLLASLAAVRFYEQKIPTKWIPLSLIMCFTAIASVLPALGWAFVAEIYPTNVRGLGSGLAGVICYVILSFNIKITPDLLAYGEPVMYGIFAAVTIVSTVILNFILPDTDGKTLQAIEDNYNNKNRTTIL